MPYLPNKQRDVDRLVAIGEPRSHLSARVPGLQLDVLAPKTAKYRVRFDLRGGRRGRRQGKSTLGDARILTIGQAEQLAREFLAKLKLKGSDPRESRENSFELSV